MITLRAHQLNAVIDASGLASAKVRTNYSGRGMEGRTCLGVTGGPSDMAAFIVGAVELIGHHPEFRTAEDVHDVFGSPATDAMGKDTIYYWPGIYVTG